MSKEYKKRTNSEHRSSVSNAEKISGQSMPNSTMQDIPSPTASSMGRTVSMPTKLRQRMESSFGADFSGIEMFESEEVGSRGADAVTLGGGKIGFAPGKLDFSSQSGQELIGHELAHVVSHARGEVKGSGFLGDSTLESQADRQGAMAAAGQSVYNGPVTPLSASSVASAEGPVQAKKGKKKETPAAAAPAPAPVAAPEPVAPHARKAEVDANLAHIQSDGRSRAGDDYFAKKFGDHTNHGQLSDSHMFRLFLRQSYGKTDEEKDNIYDMYTNKSRRGEFIDHVHGLTDNVMNMDMSMFNPVADDEMINNSNRINDTTTDTMALSDVIKDNAAELGYSDDFVDNQFGPRRQYMMSSKNEIRDRQRCLSSGQTFVPSASAARTVAYGESGVNPGFDAFRDRYLNDRQRAQAAQKEYEVKKAAKAAAPAAPQSSPTITMAEARKESNGWVRPAYQDTVDQINANGGYAPDGMDVTRLGGSQKEGFLIAMMQKARKEGDKEKIRLLAGELAKARSGKM